MVTKWYIVIHIKFGLLDSWTKENLGTTVLPSKKNLFAASKKLVADPVVIQPHTNFNFWTILLA